MKNYSGNQTQELRILETSKGWQAFQVIFWTLISLTTLVGNGLVLFCVVMKKRRSSSTIKFYGSLSLGDFLVGIFCAPVLLVAAFSQIWLIGEMLCYVYTAVISTSLNVSIMTLFLISLDRLNAVTKPFHYRAKETFTQRWATLLIVFAWLHSAFWAVAPLVGWGEIIEDPITNTCKPNWAAKGFKNTLYTMGLAGFAFALPVLSMIVVYAIIYYRSKVSARFMKNRSHMTPLAEDEARRKQQTAILRTVLVVVGAFVFCWLPYTIGTTFKLFSDTVPPYWLVHLGLMLAASNSAINPVIYSLFDKTMRGEFKTIPRVCRQQLSRPDDTDCVHSRRTSSNLATFNNTVTRISNETVNKLLNVNLTESPPIVKKRSFTPEHTTMDVIVKDIAKKMEKARRETLV